MQESFEGAKKWIRELREKSSSNVVIVLCGNKVDLSEKRQVRQEVRYLLSSIIQIDKHRVTVPQYAASQNICPKLRIALHRDVREDWCQCAQNVSSNW